MSINVNIGNHYTEIRKGNHTEFFPTSAALLELIRFIRDDDCALFVTDDRTGEKDDLSFAV